MYAVIVTGGKQYRVAPGETIRVEKLEVEPGTTLELDQVLLVADGEHVTIGAPRVPGARVTATVLKQGRGEKLIVYKYRRRKGYRRKTSHWQPFTALQIAAVQNQV